MKYIFFFLSTLYFLALEAQLPAPDVYALTVTYLPHYEMKTPYLPFWRSPLYDVNFYRNHVTLHGLWPSVFESEMNDYHNILRHCAPAREIPVNLVLPNRVAYWPNIKEGLLDAEDSFNHQYRTHGTCTGVQVLPGEIYGISNNPMDPQLYADISVKVFEYISPLIDDAIKKTRYLTKGNLLHFQRLIRNALCDRCVDIPTDFHRRSDYLLYNYKNEYITEIKFCFAVDRQLNYFVPKGFELEENMGHVELNIKSKPVLVQCTN